MRRFEIAPAVGPEEWKHRRCGAVSLDHVDGETHVVVTDPDGNIVSVSGPEETFALMALANYALPDGDARKFTREDYHELRAVAVAYYQLAGDPVVQSRVDRLTRVVGALLPPEAG